jgi:hypothetical protein
MTVKLLATGVAAAAAIGAVGVAWLAPGVAAGEPVAVQVQPMVFGAPLPLDAPESLPSAEQLTNILNNLADAGVNYQQKAPLVEGGIPDQEGHVLDHELRKAYRNGELPLSFTVGNIQEAGPNTASADVTIGGPKIPAPVTKTVTFVNQGGWILSRDSAAAVMQDISKF